MSYSRNTSEGSSSSSSSSPVSGNSHSKKALLVRTGDPRLRVRMTSAMHAASKYRKSFDMLVEKFKVSRPEHINIREGDSKDPQLKFDASARNYSEFHRAIDVWRKLIIAGYTENQNLLESPLVLFAFMEGNLGFSSEYHSPIEGVPLFIKEVNEQLGIPCALVLNENQYNEAISSGKVALVLFTGGAGGDTPFEKVDLNKPLTLPENIVMAPWQLEFCVNTPRTPSHAYANLSPDSPVWPISLNLAGTLKQVLKIRSSLSDSPISSRNNSSTSLTKSSSNNFSGTTDSLLSSATASKRGFSSSDKNYSAFSPSNVLEKDNDPSRASTETPPVMSPSIYDIQVPSPNGRATSTSIVADPLKDSSTTEMSLSAISSERLPDNNDVISPFPELQELVSTLSKHNFNNTNYVKDEADPKPMEGRLDVLTPKPTAAKAFSPHTSPYTSKNSSPHQSPLLSTTRTLRSANASPQKDNESVESPIGFFSGFKALIPSRKTTPRIMELQVQENSSDSPSQLKR
jgi:hypothetical protein